MNEDKDCCKENKGKRFCSECGERLAVATIGDLLKHCKVKARAYEKQVLLAKERLKQDTRYKGQDRRRLSRLHSAEKRLQEWTIWRDELSSLLEK
ncbi:MAG: hypothetical protein GY906_39005 [bacterium]|nr:hypothetical protein [bacterium]